MKHQPLLPCRSRAEPQPRALSAVAGGTVAGGTVTGGTGGYSSRCPSPHPAPPAVRVRLQLFPISLPRAAPPAPGSFFHQAPRPSSDTNLVWPSCSFFFPPCDVFTWLLIRLFPFTTRAVYGCASAPPALPTPWTEPSINKTPLCTRASALPLQGHQYPSGAMGTHSSSYSMG